MRVRRALIFFVVLASLQAIARAAIAQAPVSARDSVRAHNRAVQSLRQFDYQVRLLDELWTGGGAQVLGACEIAVADFCFGPTNGKLAFGGLGTWPAAGRFRPAKYSPRVETRYNFLVKRYTDSIQKVLKTIPKDQFLHAELVRVPLERANYIAAFDNLKTCGLDDWWCDAVRAYVMHVAGSQARADSLWDKVVQVMPPIERCAWLDPRWISDDDGFIKQFRTLSCSERERIANRVWWLSDPLYSVQGNERRSEHLSRSVDLLLRLGYKTKIGMTTAMVLRSKAPPNDSSVLFKLLPRTQLKFAPWKLAERWGYDELVMRAGPPHFFAPGDGVTIAQYPFPRESFVPSGQIFIDHLQARADDWNLHDPFAFEFMNGYRAPIRELGYQVAYFRRGDSARVVAATDIRGDTLLIPLKPEPQIFLQRDFDQPANRARGSGGPVYRWAFPATRDSTLASIELVATNGTAARARFATGPQPMPEQRVTLSDVLLTLPSTLLPRDLSEAEPIALSGVTIVDSANVGVFWEMYGTNSSDSISFELLVSRVRGGGIGRLLRGILGGAPDSVLNSWSEPARAREAIEPRAINLSLAVLRPAKYVLSLAIDVPGQARVITRREIEIVSRR